MNTRTMLLSLGYITWAVLFSLGVNYANQPVYTQLSAQFPGLQTFVNDIFSDAVWLFAAYMIIVLSPRFFGFQSDNLFRHWKLLLGLALFFLAVPLGYRLIAGNIPFNRNTWFFEGLVVPFAEEGFFRGVILSVLLWGFGKLYVERTAQWFAILVSGLCYGLMHLNNLGTYPTGFILFQAFYASLFGLIFGYTRVKTGSIYSTIILHAVMNMAAIL